MNRSTWQLAKEIFDEARALPTDERSPFVHHACTGNEELRTQVEKLLGAYDSDFLEDTALGAAEVLVKSALDIGQIIGRYRIKDLIGTGGMGQVFLADDTELDRPVAFKVLHNDVAEDGERVRRFIQEARAASALNHPNILTIHEIGTFEGSRFIVSEFVNGETLRDRMRAGLNTAQSLDISCQIAAALEAAHSAGIVHRDIKPENVMIRRDGLVKVLDFGLAKLTEADDCHRDPLSEIPHSEIRNPHLTAPGLVMGTVAYMSPEQARGQAVDARTDLWSLGIVLHEMLTGKSPFEGVSATDLITSILSTDITPADVGSLPPELTPICQKALTKDKEKRYQSAHDLLEDLKGEKKRMEYAIQPTPFIATSNTDELKTQLIRPRPTLSAEHIVERVKRHKFATFAVALSVTFIGIVFSVYQFKGAPATAPEVPMGAVIGPTTTEADLKMSRLPSSGKVIEISISPDGKYVAYVTEDGSTKNGIRLFQIETSADVEIVPAPAAEDYDDLAFSPDGNYLYYVLNAEKEEIYKVPIVGGTPTLIADDTECGAGASPDGKTIAFHRIGADKSNILTVADANGANERIVSKSPPDWVDRFNCGGGVPRWSPDGKELVCWGDQTEKNEKFKKLFALNVADGSRRPLSEKRWAEVNSATYMPDGSVLVAAREKPAEDLGATQLWLVAPNTDPQPITTSANNYSMISATRKGDIVVALESSFRRDLWLLPNNDVANARQVTSTGEIAGFASMPDGRIVYGSDITGSADLWSMDNDGARRKRLTINQGSNGRPAPTRDGKYILFHSNRTDNRFHVFRADPDGGNVKQLTTGFRETRPRPSPDGKWIYYIQWNDNVANTIAKIPIDGGDPVIMATAAVAAEPHRTSHIVDLDVSRDGRIAYEVAQRQWDEKEVFQGWKRTIFIVSPQGGKLIKSFDLPKTAEGNFFRWTPDGKAIAFGDMRDKSGDIWTIPVSGKPIAKRLTTFRTPITQSFDWSADGKQLLVSRLTMTNDAVIIKRNN